MMCLAHRQNLSCLTDNRERTCNKQEQKTLPNDESDSNKKKRKAKARSTKEDAAKSITPTPAKKRCSPRIAEQQKMVPFITEMGRLEEEEEDEDDNGCREDGGGGGDGDGDEDSDGSSHIYWESPEAALLFGFEKGADVRKGLEELIETFYTVRGSLNGYLKTNIIQLDKDSPLSANAVEDLRSKCGYLRAAYTVALDELHKVGVTWRACCDKAVSVLNPHLCSDHATNGRTVMKWNRIFRDHHQFPNPNPYVANGIKRKPPIFDVFPHAAVDMSTFILDRLDHFNVEMLRDHFNNTMIGNLDDEVTNNINFDEDSDEYKLVARYKDRPPSYSTVLRWVGYLGFKRELAKKCYYVDGHEYPEQLKHRAWFTDEYLRVLEFRSHRFVHLTLPEVTDFFDSLEDDNAKEMLDKVKHAFKGDNGEDVFEFHVDKHERLQQIANEKYGAFGGRVSIRKKPEDKPVIIFGQDEAIFNAHLSRTHQWVDPNGRRAIMPKTNGAGVMISGFQSRELGWGIPINEEQLRKINANRANEEYFDKEAAIAVYGTAKKKKLEASPGIVHFRYGSQQDGWWTGNHTILQLEDVIDCVKVTLGTTYDYVFLFDSSSGHAKKRIDGLDVKAMNVKWHSKASGTRTVKIEEAEGYLGPHFGANDPSMVNVGEAQTMDFTSERDLQLGPFWLTDEQREQERHDREVEIPLEKRKERVKQKKELISGLMSTDWGKAEGEINLWKTKHADLLKKAGALGIDTKVTPTTKIEYGWEGKGKGLLQIAYERGWVDKSKYKNYRVMKYDDERILIPELSLQHLLGECSDFQSEKSQLEYVCESLGARVLITTKYHAEYAGEGIEYSWGFAKSLYRRQPLERKKSLQDFLNLVKECISREVLSVDLIRKFSKRARSYMETYKVMEKEAEIKKTDDNSSDDAPIPHKRIEMLKKILKCHRAAIDFDKAFITRAVYSKDFDIKKDLLDKETKPTVTVRVKPEDRKMPAKAKKN